MEIYKKNPGVLRISFEIKLPAWLWKSSYDQRRRALRQWFSRLGEYDCMVSSYWLAQYAKDYHRATTSGSLSEIGSQAFYLQKLLKNLIEADLDYVVQATQALGRDETRVPHSVSEAAALHKIAAAGPRGLPVTDGTNNPAKAIGPAAAGLLEARDLIVVLPARFSIGRPRAHLTVRGREWVSANPEETIVRAITSDLAA